jgi:hypothetical protein
MRLPETIYIRNVIEPSFGQRAWPKDTIDLLVYVDSVTTPMLDITEHRRISAIIRFYDRQKFQLLILEL